LVTRTVIDRRVVHFAIVVGTLTAAPMGAQEVLLEIRPRVGDTMSVRLDQKVEMTGVPPGCATGYTGGRPTPGRAPAAKDCAGATRQMTSVMEVFSKAIVSASARTGSTVLAVTDSIRTALAGGVARAMKPKRIPSSSQTIELRVGTDGGTEVVDADASPQIRAIFGEMPATLSRRPVEVGETWQRSMRIPISTEAGATGTVRATFRLDSLGRNGDMAYISMKGSLSHDHEDSELNGWMSGTMQLDRRVGWITDTRAVIDVESTVKPAAGGTAMRVRTRITQALRARPVR
jgi:hypothetical protein